MWYSNGLYLGFPFIGFGNLQDLGNVLVSRNGIQWHVLANVTGLYGQAMTYFDNRLFGFGPNGSVVEFQPFAFLDVEKTANGAVKLIPTSSGTATPVIESSPDLVQWHTVSSRELSPENAQSFYRLRSN